MQGHCGGRKGETRQGIIRVFDNPGFKDDTVQLVLNTNTFSITLILAGCDGPTWHRDGPGDENHESVLGKPMPICHAVYCRQRGPDGSRD